MRPWLRLATTGLVTMLGALVFACGDGEDRQDLGSGAANGNGTGATKGDNAFSPTATGNGGTTSVTNDGGGGPALGCTDPSNAVEGCSCPTGGAEAACWTGPANLRRVELCREGKSTCQKVGEFLRWGPCTGQVLPGSQGVDAQCQATCKGDCVVGAQRWCDEPNFCAWGKQDCLPNGKGGGSWGPCKEVPVPKGCEDPISVPGFPTFYDSDCCKKLGYCCQVGGVNSVVSEGNCNGISVTCQ
ncbi:MAG: hypothetical protein U0235_23350 [Polyangiaceae bacterium]